MERRCGAGRRGRGSNPRRGGPGAAAAARLRVGAAARALAMGLRGLICIAPPLPPAGPRVRAPPRSPPLLPFVEPRREGTTRGGGGGGAVDRRAPKARPGPGGTEPSGRWDAFVWRCRGARAQRERRRGGGGGGGGGGRGRLRSGEKPPGTKSPPGCAPAAPRRAAPRTPCPRVRAALRVPAPRIGSANNARNPTRGAPGSAGMSDKRRRFPPPPPPPTPPRAPFPRPGLSTKPSPHSPAPFLFLSGPPRWYRSPPCPLGQRSGGGDPHFTADKTGAAAATGCARPLPLLTVLLGSGLGELRVGTPLAA